MEKEKEIVKWFIINGKENEMMGKRFIMNWVKGEMTMGRYIVYLVIVLGLLIGVVLLAGCEKEGVERDTGELVDLIFTVNNGGYGATTAFTRGGEIRGEADGFTRGGEMRGEADGFMRGGEMRGAGTKVVPLGDGLYLSATLKAAEGGELREALAEGQMVALVAFKASDLSIVGEEVWYDVVGGVLTPEEAGKPLRVPTGETYYFVAHSLNSSADPMSERIDPEYDLMWGRTVNPVSVTAKDLPVTINMEHLRSQVQMVMDVGGISGAVVKSMDAKVDGGLLVDLALGTGVVTPVSVNPSADQWLTFDDLPSDEAVSQIRIVTPTDPNQVSVTINEMVIEVEDEGDYTIEDQTITFDGAAEVGVSYVLEVKLRRHRWAGSNIYWDTRSTRMVFDHSGGGIASTTGDHQQGLFFKWGSLVGIETMGTNPTLYIASNDQHDWPSIDMDNVTHTYWTANRGTYTGIPYNTTDVGDALYPYYLTNNMNLAALTGDICTHIDSDWRMPTRDELGTAGEYERDNLSSVTISGLGDGTAAVSAGAMYHSAFGHVFLPASGCRFYDGALNTVFGGIYWSGSAFRSYAPYVEFSSSGMDFQYAERDSAFPVRCIKKLLGE